MDAIEKSLLSSVYIAGLTGTSPYGLLKERIPLGDVQLKEYASKLTSLGMVTTDLKLTELGRDALKVVFAGGVFDIIHPGHIHTLKSAKQLGDVLVVVIARNVTAKKSKGRTPLHDEGLRKELVSSLKFVDVAMLGHESDIFKTVELVRPNIIALGYDQVHEEKTIGQECRKRGLNVQVVRLQSPVPDLKSTSIKQDLGQSIYEI